MMESSICLLRCVIGKDVDVQCASHPISLLEPSLVPYTKKALNTVYHKYIFILQSPLPDSKLSEDRNCGSEDPQLLLRDVGVQTPGHLERDRQGRRGKRSVLSNLLLSLCLPALVPDRLILC